MIKKIAIGIIAILIIGLLTIILWPQAKYEPYAIGAEYKATTDAYYVAPMPDSWTYEMFTARDGAKLRWGHTKPNPDAKAVVIMVPGFTGTISMYGEHLTHLQNQGYDVAAFDLRGQGGSARALKSNPEKPWVKDFSVYSDDIAEFLAANYKDSPIPVILMGTSFGGHVVYRTLGDHQPKMVGGAVLIAPAFRPKTGKYSYRTAKTMAMVARLLGKSKSYAPGQGNWKPDSLDLTRPSACGTYPPRLYVRDVTFVRNPEQRTGTATYQWIAEIMKSGERITKPGYAGKVKIPVQILLGDTDHFVVNSVSEKVCGELSNCSYKTLPDTRHCVPNERDEIVNEIYGAVDNVYGQISAP